MKTKRSRAEYWERRYNGSMEEHEWSQWYPDGDDYFIVMAQYYLRRAIRCRIRDIKKKHCT